MKSYYSSMSEEDNQRTNFFINFSTNSDETVHEDWKYLIAVQCQRYKPEGIRSELVLIDMIGDKLAKELEKALIQNEGKCSLTLFIYHILLPPPYRFFLFSTI